MCRGDLWGQGMQAPVLAYDNRTWDICRPCTSSQHATPQGKILLLSVIYEGRPESIRPCNMNDGGVNSWVFSGRPSHGQTGAFQWFLVYHRDHIPGILASLLWLTTHLGQREPLAPATTWWLSHSTGSLTSPDLSTQTEDWEYLSTARLSPTVHEPQGTTEVQLRCSRLHRGCMEGRAWIQHPCRILGNGALTWGSVAGLSQIRGLHESLGISY